MHTIHEQTIHEQTVQQKTQEIYHRFGSSVRTIRRAQNWTQAELAKRAGMNKAYVVRIESGDNNVTLKTVQRIACALDIDVTVLLKGLTIKVQ